MQIGLQLTSQSEFEIVNFHLFSIIEKMAFKRKTGMIQVHTKAY